MVFALARLTFDNSEIIIALTGQAFDYSERVFAFARLTFDNSEIIIALAGLACDCLESVFALADVAFDNSEIVFALAGVASYYLAAFGLFTKNILLGYLLLSPRS